MDLLDLVYLGNLPYIEAKGRSFPKEKDKFITGYRTPTLLLESPSLGSPTSGNIRVLPPNKLRRVRVLAYATR